MELNLCHCISNHLNQAYGAEVTITLWDKDDGLTGTLFYEVTLWSGWENLTLLRPSDRTENVMLSSLTVLLHCSTIDNRPFMPNIPPRGQNSPPGRVSVTPGCYYQGDTPSGKGIFDLMLSVLWSLSLGGRGLSAASWYHPCIMIQDYFTIGGLDVRRTSTSIHAIPTWLCQLAFRFTHTRFTMSHRRCWYLWGEYRAVTLMSARCHVSAETYTFSRFYQRGIRDRPSKVRKTLILMGLHMRGVQGEPAELSKVAGVFPMCSAMEAPYEYGIYIITYN